MYKCCLPDGSYVVMFSSNEKRFFRFNDLSGSGFDELNYTKIEYLEQPDTLQEVVEWCKENTRDLMIDNNGLVCVGQYKEFEFEFTDKRVDGLLEFIRKPKLKQITIQEANEKLAEIGFEIKND